MTRSTRASAGLATVLALFAPALAAPAGAQDSDLLDPQLRDLFHEALSGERAKEHVIAITRHHRIQGSRGYRAAAQYVIEELRRCGFDTPDLPVSLGAFLQAGDLDAGWMGGDLPPWTAPGGVLADDRPAAWIESFPSDGHVVYQTWQSPSGWDIESAELRLLEPSDTPGGERIVGFPEIAMSVVTYSNPGDVTAEMVWVGSGERDEDYAGKDVAGKFVLATGYGGAVHRKAVLGHDAAAVVCFLDDGRAAEFPDMLQYTGMWPRTHELTDTTFGFNLTHRQGARLRDLALAGQKVVLQGAVRGTGLEPYWMDVVVATIPGSERPQEELVFSAHLDHPKESANDNASGSGAILDIARALVELIDTGRLPRPKRTLRFVWVPEWNGTMAYIDAHPELAGPELGGTVLGNLNLDMVGEDLEQLHSRLILTRTPDSVPSCLNDVVENMAEMVDGVEIRTPRGGRSAFNWRMTPYSGGSDHMMFIDRKVPAVMFSHSPDYTHHTSEDTPDKVDPVELERCELIATGAAWFLANLGAAHESQITDLANLVMVRASAEMAAGTRQAQRLLDAAVDGPDPLAFPAALFQSSLQLSAASERSRGAVRSLANFVPAQLDKAWLDGRLALLDTLDFRHFMQLQDAMPGTPPAAVPGSERVPVRKTRGPLDFGLPESGLPDDRAAWYRALSPPLNGDMRFELVNFVDGTRSVLDIRNAVSAEYGALPLETVQRYFEDLVRVGVIGWKP